MAEMQDGYPFIFQMIDKSGTDELLIETAKDEVEIISKLLEEEMTKAADLLVPMEAECHTGTDWFEAK